MSPRPPRSESGGVSDLFRSSCQRSGSQMPNLLQIGNKEKQITFEHIAIICHKL